MSNEIENRIINLKFNNKEFEKNAAKSIHTLNLFEKSLNKVKGVKVGFTNIIDAFKKAGSTLSKVGNGAKAALEHISHFGRSAQESSNIAIKSLSTLEEIGVGALRRLGEQALQSGENLVKSLTIDQVAAGWEKFGEKTRSVASIMSATGMSADEVADKLKKLNWYTDETSYSYSDMTNNIGKFTNAGIKLDDAITAMIGIGNAAGLAGSSVQDASHAMEGFSGAMAQGYMDRQRWSWIKTAHMDTVQFKQALIDAAESMGLLENAGDGVYGAFGNFDDDSIVTIENFENAMTKAKWLTKDVMVTALQRFGGTTEKLYDFLQLPENEGMYTSDAIKALGISEEELGLKAFKASQEARTLADAIDSVKDAVSTGLMTAFEHLIGNYEEAKELWTDLANTLWDIFADPIDRLNTELEKWGEAGGHALFRSSLYNFMETTATYIEMFKSGLDEVFGALDSDKLMRFTERFSELSEAFADTVENGTLGDIANVWKSFLSIFKAIGDGLDTVKTAFNEVFDNEPVQELSEDIAEISDAITAVREEAEKAFDAIKDIWTKGNSGLFGSGARRAEALEAIGLNPEKVQFYINKLADKEYKSLDELHDAMLKDTDSFAKNTVENVEEVTETVEESEEEVTVFGKALGDIRNVFTNIADAIKKVFEYANDNNQLVRIFTGVYSVINMVKYAFEKLNQTVFSNIVIGRVTHAVVNPLAALADRITNFANSSDVSKIGDVIVQIRNVFSEIFNIVSLIGSSFVKAIGEVLGKTSFIDIVLDLATKLAKKLKSIFAYLQQNDRLVKIFKGVISVVKILCQVLANLFKIAEPIIDVIVKVLVEELSRVGEVLSGIAENNGLDTIGNTIATVLTKVLGFLFKVYQWALKVFDFVYKAFMWVIGFISELVGRLKITEGFQKLGESIERFTTAWTKLFSNAKKSEDTTRSMAVIGEEGEKSFSWVDGIVRFLDVVSSGLSGLLDIISNVLTGVQNFIGTVNGSGDEITRGMPEEKETIFSKITNGLSGIFENVDKEKVLKGARGYSGSMFFGIFKGIGDAISSLGIDWSKVALIGTIIGFIKILLSVDKIVNSAKDFVEGFKELPVSFKGVVDAIKGTFDSITGFFGDMSDALKETIKVKKLQIMVEGLVAIVLGIAMLSQIPQQALYNAVKYLTITLVVVGIFLKVLDSLKMFQKESSTVTDNSTNKKINRGFQAFSDIQINNEMSADTGLPGVMVGLAAFIFSLAYSMKTLSEIPVQGLIQSGIVIVVALGLVTTIVWIMGTVAKKLNSVESQTSDDGSTTVTHKRSGSLWDMAGVIVAFSIFVGTISKALTAMSALNPGNMWSATGAIVAISGALVGILFALYGVYAWVHKQQGDDGIKKLGITMVLVAAAMSIIVGDIVVLGLAVALLGLLPIDNIIKGTLAVAAIVTLMMALAVVVGISAKQADPKNFIAFGVAFVLMAAALVIIAGAFIAVMAVASLISLNPAAAQTVSESIVGMVVSFVAVCLAIGILAKVAKDNSINADELIKMALAIVITSASLVVIGAALELAVHAFSTFDQAGWAFVGMVGVLLVIVAGLAALMFVMSKTNIDANSLIKIATAIVIVAGALVVLAAAVYVMSFAGEKAVGNLIAMAVTLGILVAAFAVIAALLARFHLDDALAAMAKLVQSIGIAFIGIGAAFLGFGAALWLIGEALPMIKDNLPGVTKALEGFVQLVENHIGAFIVMTLIVAAVAIGIAGLVGVIVWFVSTLVQNAGPIGNFFTDMFDKIKEIAKKIWDFIKDVGEKFDNLPDDVKEKIKKIAVAVVAGLALATPEMVQEIGKTILKVIGYIGQLIPFVIDALFVLLLKIIEGLANTIRKNSKEILWALLDVVEALLEIVLDALQLLMKAIVKLFVQTSSGAAMGIAKAFGISADAVTATLDAGVDSIISGMESAKDAMRGGLNDLAKEWDLDVNTATDKMEDSASGAGGSMWDNIAGIFGGGQTGETKGLGDMFGMEGLPDLSKLAGGDFNMDDLKETFTGEDGAFNTGQLEEFIGGINSGGIDISNFSNGSIADLQKMATENGMSLDIMGNDAINLGENFNVLGDDVNFLAADTESAFGDMLVATAENSEDAQAAVSQNLDEGIEAVRGKRIAMFQAGVNLIKGLEEGIDSEYNYVRGSLISKFQDIVNTAAKEWDENSPSKVFFQIGAYAMIGLANGGYEYGAQAEDAFSQVVSNISDAIDLSEDWQPTITPVVDMTNVQSSAYGIGRMFGAQSIALANENSILDAKRREMIMQQNQNSIYSDANVLESINGLREDVNNLNGAMSGMRVVMDSGALVGATVGPMDAALGRRAQRTKRGG